MLVVLPVCTQDEHLALLGLKVARSLDNSVPFHCVIVHDRGHSVAAVVAEARQYFRVVTELVIEPCPFGRDWPRPQNWAWQQTAIAMLKEQEPWLWWEPDAVPIRKGWIEAIAGAYEQAQLPFAGHIDRSQSKPLLSGVAVYPANAGEICEKAMLTRSGPFDIVLSQLDHMVSKAADIGHLIHHETVAERGEQAWYKGDRLPNCALWHRCKNTSLQQLILGELASAPFAEVMQELDQSFLGNPCGFHAGDRGDVIYALPLCRALGITKLYLCPAPCTRELMTPAAGASIAALVREQPYMESCEFLAKPPEDAVDLNQFRRLLGPDFVGRYHYHNLSALQLRWFKLNEDLESLRWLWVTPKRLKKNVVFSRSPRYHSAHFDWTAVLKKYGSHAIFVGTAEEHRTFIKEVGYVPHAKTPTLLDAAQIIAGSDLFVGNQSCPYAIAEGLKHPAILEWVPGPSQNCHFSRSGLTYGTEHQTLPNIQTKPKVNWVALSDLHSGFGRMAHAFYIRSKSVDMNWVPTRFSEEFVRFDKAISLKHKRESGLSVVLDSVPVIHDFIQPGDVACTMWESSRLPQTAVKAINLCQAAIIPTEWCRQVFLDSGITVPIFKVPLGVDNLLYRPPEVRPKKEAMLFGASTRFCHDGNPRKNIQETIDGFLKAFPTEKDVCLFVKGYDSSTQFLCGDPRVKIVVDFWSEIELMRWYQSLDCFINLPRGGGWELHVHEAMLCGAVPIILNYSSSLEFVDRTCGFLVDYKLEDAKWHVYDGCGQWARPDMDSYIATLRHVYANRDEVERRRAKARRAVNHLTWDNAAEIMDRTLLNLI